MSNFLMVSGDDVIGGIFGLIISFFIMYGVWYVTIKSEEPNLKESERKERFYCAYDLIDENALTHHDLLRLTSIVKAGYNNASDRDIEWMEEQS